VMKGGVSELSPVLSPFMMGHWLICKMGEATSRELCRMETWLQRTRDL
jgi:hypothetical protein